MTTVYALPSQPLSSSINPTSQPQPDSPPVITEVIVTCPSGNYVSTPDGCVPKECAFGSVNYVDTKTGSMVFDNGTQIVIPSNCLKGSPAISKVEMYSDGSMQTIAGPTMNPPGTSSTQPPTTNSWVENTHYSNCILIGICKELSSFSGYWIVPNVPSNSASQTIYLFIGEEDYWMTEIIQPVLQWGPSCTGGGNYWSIASYLVWGSACSQSTHTGQATVKAGQLIYGSMQDMGGGKWKIFVEDMSCGSSCSETETVGANTMYNAYVTLEAYNVVSCNEYPASGSTYFYNMYITGGTPGWSQSFPDKDCGSADHISTTSGQPSTVTLYY